MEKKTALAPDFQIVLAMAKPMAHYSESTTAHPKGKETVPKKVLCLESKREQTKAESMEPWIVVDLELLKKFGTGSLMV